MQPDQIIYHRPIIIGIAGGSASGKSSIARAISNHFTFPVPVISQDWYYRALDDPAKGPTHNWDHPDAFDSPAISAALIAWKNGESVGVPRHDYATYTRRENVEVIPAAPIMIFEGILAFYDSKIAALFDYKFFVECDTDVALTRRIARDIKERGYEFDEIIKRYLEYVKPSFDTFIRPLKRSAHMVINNTETQVRGDSIPSGAAVRIINGFIQDYVKDKFTTHSLAAPI